MALIEIRNLTKVFPGETETHALRGVSFDIEKGEYVAIIGPSGSGKSTLLQILGLLDRQTAGTYRFSGITTENYSEIESAHLRNTGMGFVFQSFNLLPRTAVIENVKLPLLYSKVPIREWDERAKLRLEEVGLSHRLQHEPAQLSGGEKQRVAIARALVTNPEVIFADEPTGNLDSVSGKTIIAHFRELHRQGHTIVLITHDPTIAANADRVLTIMDGLLESDRRSVDKSKHS